MKAALIVIAVLVFVALASSGPLWMVELGTGLGGPLAAVVAAVVLGASGWQIFWRVTLPNVKWGLLYGVILCNARAMGELKEAGFWCLGLAAEGRQTLGEIKPGGRIALCLGAEGSGLRRLTRDHCDVLVRLPTAGPIDHLNVSNAAAISLYELVR